MVLEFLCLCLGGGQMSPNVLVYHSLPFMSLTGIVGTIHHTPLFYVVAGNSSSLTDGAISTASFFSFLSDFQTPTQTLSLPPPSKATLYMPVLTKMKPNLKSVKLPLF